MWWWGGGEERECVLRSWGYVSVFEWTCAPGHELQGAPIFSPYGGTGDLREPGLGILGIFLLPGWLGSSEIISHDLTALLVRNRVAWWISKWPLSPSSCWNPKGIFLCSSLWEPGWVPEEGEARESLGSPWSFNSQNCLQWPAPPHPVPSPLQFHLFKFRISYPRLVPTATSAPESLLLSIAILCLSRLSKVGAVSHLWPHFSDGPKKSCWFSVCSALLFVLRMDWWRPRSLHTKPEVKGTSFHWYWAPRLRPSWIPWAFQPPPRALPMLPLLLQAACLPVSFTCFWTSVSGLMVASPRIAHRLCSSFPVFLLFWPILAAPWKVASPGRLVSPLHACPLCQGSKGFLFIVSDPLKDWLLLPISLFCRVKESFSLPWDAWPWCLDLRLPWCTHHTLLCPVRFFVLVILCPFLPHCKLRTPGVLGSGLNHCCHRSAPARSAVRKSDRSFTPLTRQTI